MLSVELRHVRYVIEAAERGSFRAAARALGIEQSAVSRRIRDLEDVIGVSLFIRDATGARLSDAGKRFVERARRAVTHLRIATEDAGRCGRGEVGLLRIGITCSLAGGLLREVLSAYTKGNPGVRTEIVEGGSADHISAIRRLQLDVAFLAETPSIEGGERTFLWRERIFVVVPDTDELAKEDEIRWDQLRDRCFIVSEDDPVIDMREYLVKTLAMHGVCPRIERYCLGRDNLLHLIAISGGLTLTCESAAAIDVPGVTFRPLRGEVLTFSAIWLRRNDNPALRRMISLARSIARQWRTMSVAPENINLEAHHVAEVFHARCGGRCAFSGIPDRSP